MALLHALSDGGRTLTAFPTALGAEGGIPDTATGTFRTTASQPTEKGNSASREAAGKALTQAALTLG